MNTVDPKELKAKKNCLLVFRNKKINDFAQAEGIIEGFAASGYYFDKISYVAYDKSEEIVHALLGSKENYENTVILCPLQMESMFKSFIAHQYCSHFDEKGMLSSEKENVFLLLSDGENKLSVEEITRVLDEKYAVKYEKAYIRAVGIPPEKLNNAIASARAAAENLQFNVSEAFGDCRLEIVYSDKTPKSVFDKAFRALVEKLNEYIYSLDDSTLAERLYQLLKLRRMKISVAESFTGGGIAKKLVEVPGISEVYFEGINSYSNESKIQRLGVDKFTISRYGAVSEQTAHEMATGLLNGGNCSVAIATTGIAGPKSDNTSKPVGLIYIAAGTQDNVNVYKFNLNGGRECITNTAINLALFLAYKALK